VKIEIAQDGTNQNWQDLGCFGPVKSGDTIQVIGNYPDDLNVLIDGTPMTSQGCPND
jgi:hypothetical protein